MIEKNIKAHAIWFISQETERILRDLESGLITRDQAIGSYNTVYSIASGIEDAKHMKVICRIMSHIRSTNVYFNLRKMYLSNYFSEESQVLEMKEMKEIKEAKEPHDSKELKEIINQ
ncbi:hypothetical protein [Paenibacillus aestuarii]|uniref:Uncharacterized protein n=1 Tax=Paenibacillus aestuarii TaxID=516965 RepID=A0ABW0KGK8_9BACL|nr:hypothetical protein [Paenibacillus aestuarii]